MNALGFIETSGLIAAIEAADTMVKTANVSLIRKEYVGKGLVTIIVEGDVGAVQSAVEAGVEAVHSLRGVVHSHNVIPSPSDELEIFICDETAEKDLKKEKEAEESKEELEDEVETDEAEEQLAFLVKTKDDVTALLESYTEEEGEKVLRSLTNKTLKSLLQEFVLSQEQQAGIQKMNKTQLVDLIMSFYKKS